MHFLQLFHLDEKICSIFKSAVYVNFKKSKYLIRRA